MFFDCMKVKLRSRRRLRPKSTIGCDIASFIQALVCPYFFSEESEKRKKCLSAKFFILISSPIFLRQLRSLRRACIQGPVVHRNKCQSRGLLRAIPLASHRF